VKKVNLSTTNASSNLDKGNSMPICITGMRSGSSMIARLLRICGLYLGPDGEMMPAEAYDNPEGYWENLRFVALNDELLTLLDAAWDKPPTAQPGWAQQARFAGLRESARHLIAEFEPHAPWGWKDPRNSLTIEFWQELIPDLKVVICLRHPWEVASSLSKNPVEPRPLATGLDLWLRSNERVLQRRRSDRDDPGDNRIIVTHFDAYFYDPRAELRRVARLIGLDPSDSKIEEAVGTISSALRRNVSVKQADGHELPENVRRLYLDLCARAGPIYQQARTDAVLSRGGTVYNDHDVPPYAVALKAELDNLRQEHEQTLVYVQTLESQLAAARKGIQDTADYAVKLEKEVKSLRNEHQKVAAHHQTLENLVAATRDNTEQSTAYATKLETELADRDRLNTELADYVHKLEAEVDNLKTALEPLQTSAVDSQTLESLLAAARDNIVQTTQYATRLEAEFGNLQRTYGDAIDYIKKLESAVADRDRLNTEVTDYARKLEAQIGNMQTAMDALQSHSVQQGDAWREASEYARSLEVKVQDLEEHLRQYQEF
jgi:predicted  nucleic acid-binding Zn-ribbon protein